MSGTKIEKHKIDLFGRNLTLMLNRASMYAVGHPYVKQAIESAYEATVSILQNTSPLVFIMSQEQFFIDEEPLDPRVNASRIVTQFKKKGIQSVSFEKGLEKREMRSFVEIYSQPDKFPDAEAIKKALTARRVNHLKINHVFYKKVTVDDEVISKDVLRKITPDITEEAQLKSKKMFLDALLESVLTEEFLKTLNINNLIKDPKAFSRQMVEVDLQNAGKMAFSSGDAGTQDGGAGTAGAQGKSGIPGQGVGPGVEVSTGKGTNSSHISQKGAEGFAGTGVGGGEASGPMTQTQTASGSGEPTGPSTIAGEGTPGPVLLQQLELLGQEIEKNLVEATNLELPELANAVFEMKKQLMEAIEEQKVVGKAFSNEELIMEKANEITDKVLLKLIKEEYGGGSVSVPRLAQVIKRLVPEADELKRLLPKIKKVLLEEGMELEEYLQLIRELSKELKGEEIAKLLEESSEEIGVDGEKLIEEVKKNPEHAAELIYLAAEIKKGSGDEKLLTEILVDYLERLGMEMSLDVGQDGTAGGEKHFRKVMSQVQSKLLEKLQNKDLKDDVIFRLEERLNQRVDEVLDKLRVEWLKSQGGTEKAIQEQLSVLETLEQSVGENEELADILKVVRSKVEAEEIDENDFAQIYNEIIKEKQRREQKETKKQLPAGILDEHSLLVFLEKEIAKVSRYNIPFSALAFTVVKAKPRVRVSSDKISRQAILDKVLYLLAKAFRDTDVVGQIGKNKIVALLPMTPLVDAKLALRRVTRILHSTPIEVNGVRFDIRVAGVASDIGEKEKPDLESFLENFSTQLTDMATRIRNIHAYL